MGDVMPAATLQDVNRDYQYDDSDNEKLLEFYLHQLIGSGHLVLLDESNGQKKLDYSQQDSKQLNFSTQWLYRQTQPLAVDDPVNTKHPVVVLSARTLVHSANPETDFIHEAQRSLLHYWMHHDQAPHTFRVEALINRNSSHWIHGRLEFTDLAQHFKALDEACQRLQANTKQAWVKAYEANRTADTKQKKDLAKKQYRSFVSTVQNERAALFSDACFRLADSMGVAEAKLKLIADEIKQALQCSVKVKELFALKQEGGNDCAVFANYSLFEYSLLNKDARHEFAARVTNSEQAIDFAKQRRLEHIKALGDDFCTKQKNNCVNDSEDRIYFERVAQGVYLQGFDLWHNSNEKDFMEQVLAYGLEQQVLQVGKLGLSSDYPQSIAVVDMVTHNNKNHRYPYYLTTFADGAPLILFGMLDTINLNFTDLVNAHHDLMECVVFHFNQHLRRACAFNRFEGWGKEISLPPTLMMGTIVNVEGQWTPIKILLQQKDVPSDQLEHVKQFVKDANDKEDTRIRLNLLKDLVDAYYHIGYQVACYQPAQNSGSAPSAEIQRALALEQLCRLLLPDTTEEEAKSLSLTAMTDRLEQLRTKKQEAQIAKYCMQLRLYNQHLPQLIREESLVRKILRLVAGLTCVILVAAGAWPLLVSAFSLTIPLWGLTAWLSAYSMGTLLSSIGVGLVGLGFIRWDVNTQEDTPRANPANLDTNADIALMIIAVSGIGFALFCLVSVSILSTSAAIGVLASCLVIFALAYNHYANECYASHSKKNPGPEPIYPQPIQESEYSKHLHTLSCTEMQVKTDEYNNGKLVQKDLHTVLIQSQNLNLSRSSSVDESDSSSEDAELNEMQQGVGKEGNRSDLQRRSSVSDVFRKAHDLLEPLPDSSRCVVNGESPEIPLSNSL